MIGGTADRGHVDPAVAGDGAHVGPHPWWIGNEPRPPLRAENTMNELQGVGVRHETSSLHHRETDVRDITLTCAVAAEAARMIRQRSQRVSAGGRAMKPPRRVVGVRTSVIPILVDPRSRDESHIRNRVSRIVSFMRKRVCGRCFQWGY